MLVADDASHPLATAGERARLRCEHEAEILHRVAVLQHNREHPARHSSGRVQLALGLVFFVAGLMLLAETLDRPSPAARYEGRIVYELGVENPRTYFLVRAGERLPVDGTQLPGGEPLGIRPADLAAIPPARTPFEPFPTPAPTRPVLSPV